MQGDGQLHRLHQPDRCVLRPRALPQPIFYLMVSPSGSESLLYSFHETCHVLIAGEMRKACVNMHAQIQNVYDRVRPGA